MERGRERDDFFFLILFFHCGVVRVKGSRVFFLNMLKGDKREFFFSMLKRDKRGFLKVDIS